MEFEEVARDLRRRLMAGEWPVGQYLPSSAKLRTQYGASGAGGLQPALMRLREEGLIESRDGIGYRVMPRPDRGGGSDSRIGRNPPLTASASLESEGGEESKVRELVEAAIDDLDRVRARLLLALAAIDDQESIS